MNRFRIIRGDADAELPRLGEGLADAIVTDPPAGIGLLGIDWDKDRGGRTEWIKWLTRVLEKSRRVLVPGGWALVWALPRTAHWTATAVEDAGFVVRDVVVHIFGNGFPKSRACLKPAAEHWILARAPAPRGEKGAELGIEEARIGLGKRVPTGDKVGLAGGKGAFDHWTGGGLDTEGTDPNVGRWPANVVLSHLDGCETESHEGGEGEKAKRCAPSCPVAELDRQGGTFGSGATAATARPRKGSGSLRFGMKEDGIAQPKGDAGGVSRYFFSSKVSSCERGDCEHPTMKPAKLMAHFVRLICPPGGVVLDPFCGAGGVGLGTLSAARDYVGIELDPKWAETARGRLADWMPLLCREDPELLSKPVV